MRRHTSPRTGSPGALRHHLEEGHREGLRHELERDGLQVPAALAEDGLEERDLVLRHGIRDVVEAIGDVALEHLVVARLVHHLRGLEELEVGALHDVHELAAREQGALLAVHEHAEAPGRDAAVEGDLVRLRQRVPQRAAVDVDELVGDDAAVRGGGRVPRDVRRRVPLIALGLLVEPAQVRGVDGIVEVEGRGEGRRESSRLSRCSCWLRAGVPTGLVL